MRTPKSKAWAEIDLSALAGNYNAVVKEVKKHSADAKVIAVVKADAYGHGAKECVKTLAKSGCEMFAVSSASEAIDVRKVTDKDVLILGYTPCEEADILACGNITQTVMSLDYARDLDSAVREYKAKGKMPENAKLKVHIKLDTGMNRIGFGTHDITALVSDVLAVSKLPNLEIAGMFTHFACADSDEGRNAVTAEQTARYMRAKAALEEAGLTFGMCHICNSAGAMYLPDSYMDAVRAGIILYGASPSGNIGEAAKFTPVMTLKTLVAQVHEVKAGETVGYGAAYKAEKDMTVATLAVGYADGFIRAFANGGTVRLSDGTDAKLCGRICMDQCMVDVSGRRVKQGDEVILFGGDDGTMLENLAAAAGTINYELLCLVGKRVDRKYIRKK